jgi:RHS repeat-associated protein
VRRKASDRRFYAKARFYDPEIGRFLSQDSFLGDVNEPPSLHRYFYANDNPLLFVDPTGNFSWKDLTTSSWLARAGRALQEIDVGSDLTVNFGVQFIGQAAQLPEQIGTGLLNLVTPGGLDVVTGEAPAAPPASASRYFQVEALKEAANPENPYLLRGALGATAVLSQPMVVIEEALINPIREVPQSSGRVGLHISRAIDADNSVDRSVHILEATKEATTAFGTLAGLATGVQGAVRAGQTRIAGVVPEVNLPPRALPPGRQPTALLSGRAESLAVSRAESAAIKPGTRFIADADGNVLDLASGRGKINPISRQGPISLPETLSSSRVPNPYGRLGSPAHRAQVAAVRSDIEARGLVAETEVPVRTVGGVKGVRYMDVVARDPMTRQIVEVHQVGKVLKSNRNVPVARERAALRDVRYSPEVRGAKRVYHEY